MAQLHEIGLCVPKASYSWSMNSCCCYPRQLNGRDYTRCFKIFDKTTHTIFQTFKDVDVENVSSPLNQRLSNLVFYNVYLGFSIWYFHIYFSRRWKQELHYLISSLEIRIIILSALMWYNEMVPKLYNYKCSRTFCRS